MKLTFAQPIVYTLLYLYAFSVVKVLDVKVPPIIEFSAEVHSQGHDWCRSLSSFGGKLRRCQMLDA